MNKVNSFILVSENRIYCSRVINEGGKRMKQLLRVVVIAILKYQFYKMERRMELINIIKKRRDVKKEFVTIPQIPQYVQMQQMETMMNQQQRNVK